jgi:predicted nucleic acid-binding protein
MLTIDANIWISAITPSEADHAASREFLRKVSSFGLTVVVPTLLRAEIAATLSRTSAVPRTVVGLSKVLASLPTIRWIGLDEDLADVAAKIATDYQLRGADAVYAAVASEHNCWLVTLDQEHLQRLPRTMTVLTPANANSRFAEGHPT